MAGAELGKAKRQVAVGFEALVEDLHVAGAVHRFQRVDALFLGALFVHLYRDYGVDLLTSFPRFIATPGPRDYGLALGLVGVAAAWGLSQPEADYLIGRYRRPEPRLALAPLLRQYATAAMDLSDGLVKDAERMLRGSGLGGQLRAGDVPLSEAARKVLAREPERLAQLITGGDDYEVLAAVPGTRTQCDEFRTAIATAGVALTDIGAVDPSAWRKTADGLRIDAPDGRPLALDRTGWDHF